MRRISSGGITHMSRSPKDKYIYALYKGEENLMDGTLEEIHQKSGLQMKFLRWMTTPSASRRFTRSVQNKRMCLVLIEKVM